MKRLPVLVLCSLCWLSVASAQPTTRTVVRPSPSSIPWSKPTPWPPLRRSDTRAGSLSALVYLHVLYAFRHHDGQGAFQLLPMVEARLVKLRNAGKWAELARECEALARVLKSTRLLFSRRKWSGPVTFVRRFPNQPYLRPQDEKKLRATFQGFHSTVGSRAKLQKLLALIVTEVTDVSRKYLEMMRIYRAEAAALTGHSERLRVFLGPFDKNNLRVGNAVKRIVSLCRFNKLEVCVMTLERYYILPLQVVEEAWDIAFDNSDNEQLCGYHRRLFSFLTLVFLLLILVLYEASFRVYPKSFPFFSSSSLHVFVSQLPGFFTILLFAILVPFALVLDSFEAHFLVNLMFWGLSMFNIYILLKGIVIFLLSIPFIRKLPVLREIYVGAETLQEDQNKKKKRRKKKK